MDDDEAITRKYSFHHILIPIIAEGHYFYGFSCFFYFLFFIFILLFIKNCTSFMHENGREDTEKTVFAIIKKLVPFLEFVKDHPATLPEHKNNADRIAGIIEKIETYRGSRNWCISFAIFSEKLLRSPEEGLSRYDWRTSLESDILSIEAERRYYPFSVKTLNYVYSFHYNFRTGKLSDAGEKDISLFIEDVLRYKEYVTRKLPDIETEIELFE